MILKFVVFIITSDASIKFSLKIKLEELEKEIDECRAQLLTGELQSPK